MTAAILAGVAIATALLTGVVRRLALRRGMLDVPNERSSHAVPTPRGGGLAIVCACAAGWLALHQLGALDGGLLAALLGGGVVVAAVGWLDDRRPLHPATRLVVHFAAAAWGVYWLDGVSPLQLGNVVCDLGVAGDLLGVLCTVWVLNLFNFMDGIDGIAASESTWVAAAGAGLTLCVAGISLVAPAALVLAAASLGFLLWNWPPARIFMGDIGSGFLGYSLAILAMAAAREHPVSVWCWLILAALFFVDATVTLLRRLLRRQRVYQAHRSHAYQKLATKYGHRPVTVGLIALNVALLAPAALLAQSKPQLAPFVCLAVLVSVAIACLRVGAGR
jgi:Fuc2NAc and GlcNAc transferase